MAHISAICLCLFLLVPLASCYTHSGDNSDNFDIWFVTTQYDSISWYLGPGVQTVTVYIYCYGYPVGPGDGRDFHDLSLYLYVGGAEYKSSIGGRYYIGDTVSATFTVSLIAGVEVYARAWMRINTPGTDPSKDYRTTSDYVQQYRCPGYPNDECGHSPLGCLRHPLGGFCQCNGGMTATPSGSCLEIDECAQNVCPQNGNNYCYNFIGGFQCYTVSKTDVSTCTGSDGHITFSKTNQQNAYPKSQSYTAYLFKDGENFASTTGTSFSNLGVGSYFVVFYLNGPETAYSSEVFVISPPSGC